MAEDHRKEGRAERRRRRRNRQGDTGDVRATANIGHCYYPHLFSTPACCICGHRSAAQCPCDAVGGLVHLERAHPGKDEESSMMREMMGCSLPGSEPVSQTVKGEHVGQFQAPCGDLVAYATTAHLATLALYRWHALYDHLEGGACRSPDICGSAVMSGTV